MLASFCAMKVYGVGWLNKNSSRKMGAIWWEGCDSPGGTFHCLSAWEDCASRGVVCELLRRSLKVRNREFLHPLVDVFLACLTRRVWEWRGWIYIRRTLRKWMVLEKHGLGCRRISQRLEDSGLNGYRGVDIVGQVFHGRWLCQQLLRYIVTLEEVCADWWRSLGGLEVEKQAKVESGKLWSC